MKRLAIASLVFLSACAGEQRAAGITLATVKWCADDKGVTHLCGAEIIDGKERADVVLNVTLPNGASVRYLAKDVRAFKAHEIRAAVETALIETTGEAAPEIVSSIVRGVLGTQAIDLIGQTAEGKAQLEAVKLKAKAMQK